MKKVLIIIFIVLLCIFSVLLYSRYIATSGLITKEYVITTNIAESYDGFKIVHFSDLHYGRLITNQELNKISEEINLINADIVVFTGDLIDKSVDINNFNDEELICFLSSIKAKYGKYAVRGDNDYLVYADKIKSLYTDADFTYLENSYDILYNENNDKIFIGGLDTSFYDKEDLDKVLTYEIDNISYKIVLTHEPDISDDIINKDNTIDLILAGHSHNGQVRFPIIGALKVPEKATKYYDNYYKIKNTDLYVSSGIGVSDYDFRLFNRPSINFYRIYKK